MKTITLEADADFLEAAEERAGAQRTTLDEQFREWLEDYAARHRRAEKAMRLIDEMRKYAHTGGRKFTREERNER